MATNETLLSLEQAAALLQRHMPEKDSLAWLVYDSQHDPVIPFILKNEEIYYAESDLNMFARRISAKASLRALSDRRVQADRRMGPTADKRRATDRRTSLHTLFRNDLDRRFHPRPDRRSDIDRRLRGGIDRRTHMERRGRKQFRVL